MKKLLLSIIIAVGILIPFASRAAQGDIYYGSSTYPFTVALPIGSNLNCLESNGTIPVWSVCSSGGGGSGGGTFSTTTIGPYLFQYPYAEMITSLYNTSTTTSPFWFDPFSSQFSVKASTTISGPLTVSKITATSTASSTIPTLSLSNLFSTALATLTGYITTLFTTNATTTSLAITGLNSKILSTDAFGNVLGTTTNSGTVTSITAGTGLTGGTITTTGTIALSTPVSIANGGTNATAIGASSTIAVSTGSAVGYVSTIPTTDLTGTLGVGNGGTGQSSLTSGQLLVGNGTAGILSEATGTETCSSGVSCTPFTVVGSGGAITNSNPTNDWYQSGASTTNTVSNAISTLGYFGNVIATGTLQVSGVSTLATTTATQITGAGSGNNILSIGTTTQTAAEAYIQGINGVTPFIIASSTANNIFAVNSNGGVTDTLDSNNEKSFTTQVLGESQPRSYFDGYGDVDLGGTGSVAPQFQIGKDPFTSSYLNFKCLTDGPCIDTFDSYIATVCNTSLAPTSTDGETTQTRRVLLPGSSNSQWIDDFYNYYCSDGDINSGVLMQELGTGSYVPYMFAYNNDAVSDPKGQTKDAAYFSQIEPYDIQGTYGGMAISGTGSVSTSSPTLTGVGTSFGTSGSLNVGDSFAIGGIYGTVLSVQSTTSLTMTASSTATYNGDGINKFDQFLGEEGIRVRNPSAFIDIGGGDTTTPALKLENSTLTTTAQAGAIENSGGQLYYSPGAGSRYNVFLNDYGVQGGQTLVGGQGNGDSLLLESTSAGTKGLIYLGGDALSAYNESNTRLGIATTVPQTALSVVGTTTTSNLNISGLSSVDLAVDASGNVVGTTTSSGGGGTAYDMLSNLANSVNHITSTSTAVISKWNYVTGSSNYTVTLPLAASTTGQFIGLRMGTSTALTGLITIQASSTDLIDGTSTRVMWSNEVAVLYSDGLTWTKVAGKTIPMVASCSLTSESASNGSATKLPCSGVLFDNTGLMVDHSVNDRINILRPDIYEISINDEGENFSGSGTLITDLYINGTSVSQSAQPSNQGAGYNYPIANFTTNQYISKNSYVEDYAFQFTGGTQTIAGNELSLIEIPSW